MLPMPKRAGPGMELVDEDKKVTVKEGTIKVTSGVEARIIRNGEVEVKKGSLITWQYDCNYDP
jgi:hypothetical protein